MATSSKKLSCKARRKDGKRCGIKGSKLCFYHKMIEEVREKQGSMYENCPICLENVTDYIEFDCSHSVCTECLKQFNKLECPVCRAKLTKDNIGKEIYSDISRNIRKEKREREMQDEQAAREYQEMLRNGYPVYDRIGNFMVYRGQGTTALEMLLQLLHHG